MEQEKMKRIIELIKDGKETEIVDFKRDFYAKECKSDMIKDIISFANNCFESDKYIIFGFDNKEKVFYNVDYNRIEDISNYVQLLNEYIEPFIDFALDTFTYNNTNMAYICINNTNMNRPYMIKKEYCRNEKSLLRRGEIYIRKNANNFIATRDDLDTIYEARNQLKLNPDNAFYKVTLKNGVERKNLWALNLGIINNTNFNFSINNGKLLIKLKTNCFSVDILYIEDHRESYNTSIKHIKVNPLSVSSLTQLSKVLIFELSEKLEQILINYLRINENPNIEIVLTDIEEKEHKKTIELKSM